MVTVSQKTTISRRIKRPATTTVSNLREVPCIFFNLTSLESDESKKGIINEKFQKINFIFRDCSLVF